MKRYQIISGVLLLASMAFGALPQYEIDLDSQRPYGKWEIKTDQGSMPWVRANLSQNGTNWAPGANEHAYMWYTTNEWLSTNYVQLTGTVANTYIDFYFDSNFSATNGSFLAGIVMTNDTTGRKYAWPQGRVKFRRNPGLTQSGVLNFVSNIDGATRGDLATYSGSEWVRLAIGTAGQQLSTGPSTNLVWVNQNTTNNALAQRAAAMEGRTNAWNSAGSTGVTAYVIALAAADTNADQQVEIDAMQLRSNTWDGAATSGMVTRAVVVAAASTNADQQIEIAALQNQTNTWDGAASTSVTAYALGLVNLSTNGNQDTSIAGNTAQIVVVSNLLTSGYVRTNETETVNLQRLEVDGGGYLAGMADINTISNTVTELYFGAAGASGIVNAVVSDGSTKQSNSLQLTSSKYSTEREEILRDEISTVSNLLDTAEAQISALEGATNNWNWYSETATLIAPTNTDFIFWSVPTNTSWKLNLSACYGQVRVGTGPITFNIVHNPTKSNRAYNVINTIAADTDGTLDEAFGMGVVTGGTVLAVDILTNAAWAVGDHLEIQLQGYWTQ